MNCTRRGASENRRQIYDGKLWFQAVGAVLTDVCWPISFFLHGFFYKDFSLFCA